MKKILVLFLSIIYFIVSTGFIVNVHYCMGKVSTIKFEEPKQKCCCKKKHKGCCKTEQKLVKLSSNSKLADAYIASNASFSEITFTPSFTFYAPSKISSFADADLSYKYTPPIKIKKFALLHYCILRV